MKPTWDWIKLTSYSPRLHLHFLSILLTSWVNLICSALLLIIYNHFRLMLKRVTDKMPSHYFTKGKCLLLCNKSQTVTKQYRNNNQGSFSITLNTRFFWTSRCLNSYRKSSGATEREEPLLSKDCQPLPVLSPACEDAFVFVMASCCC